MKKLLYKLKYLYNIYIINNVILNLLNSPLKLPKLKFYFGKISVGTPYFYPRRWIKTKNGHTPKTCKYFKIDIVNLGYKTKWSSSDYRFEWGPLLSIVILNKQFCVFLYSPTPDNLISTYWETYLLYKNHTNKNNNIKQRTRELVENYPCKITSWKDGNKETIYPYKHILKEKYLYIYYNYNRDDKESSYDDYKNL